MLLKNGDLIAGNGEYLEHTDLRVEDGLITECDQNLPTRSNETQVDLTNHWVLPGLIDAHVHIVMSSEQDPYGILTKSLPAITIDAVNNARRLLHAGFTTVRDMGARGFIDIAVRNAIAEGKIEGPRMKVSGECIIMTGGHGWFLGGRQADGPSECRKAAREQLFQGADLLKMMATGGGLTREGEPGASQLDEDELASIVHEAHKAGKKAAAHCHGLDGIKNAVRAGVDSVEHGTFADEEILAEMKKQGTYLSICMRATSLQTDNDSLPAYMVDRANQILDFQLDNCRRAHEMGVKQVFSTDAGTPGNCHGDNAKEFPFFIRCGFNEMEAIQLATSKAAELLGIDDTVGTLEVGRFADILVTKHNPLEDIAVLAEHEKEIALLLKEGRVVRSQVPGINAPDDEIGGAIR